MPAVGRPAGGFVPGPGFGKLGDLVGFQVENIKVKKLSTLETKAILSPSGDQAGASR